MAPRGKAPAARGKAPAASAARSKAPKRARVTVAGFATADEINKSCISSPEAFERWSKITDDPMPCSVDEMLSSLEQRRGEIEERVRTLRARPPSDAIFTTDFDATFWSAIKIMGVYVNHGNATLAAFEVASTNVDSAIGWINRQERRALPDGMQCPELDAFYERENETLIRIGGAYEDVRHTIERARDAIGHLVQEYGRVALNTREGFEVLQGRNIDARAMLKLRAIGSSHALLEHFRERAAHIDYDYGGAEPGPESRMYGDMIRHGLCKFPTTPEEYDVLHRDMEQGHIIRFSRDMSALRTIARSGAAINASITLGALPNEVYCNVVMHPSTMKLKTWCLSHTRSFEERISMLQRILPALTPGGCVEQFDSILVSDTAIIQLCDAGDFDVETRARMLMRLLLCEEGYVQAREIAINDGDGADDALSFHHADVPHYIHERAAAGGAGAIYPTHDGVTSCRTCMAHCSKTYSVSCAACACVMCEACVVRACTTTPACISDDYNAFMCPACPNRHPTRLADFEKMQMLNHRREAVAKARIERAVQCTYVDAERRSRADMLARTREISGALEQALRTGLDDAMNLKCPSCRTVFVDHDACKSLLCSNTAACGVRFCGFGCGLWFGNDVEVETIHDHLRQCQFNKYPERGSGELSFSVPAYLWATIAERTVKRQVMTHMDSLSENERVMLMNMRGDEIRAATHERIDAMCVVPVPWEWRL